MHTLDNNWTVWMHMPNDIDWSINSYKKIYNFKTLEDCILFIENINKEIVEKCMLFIMKNNIKPIWEDISNKKGGSFSYKINIENIHDIWKKLVYYLIGNTLSDNVELLNNINGISISPKKNFCIIKFWIGDIDNLTNNIIYNKYIKIDVDKNNSLGDNEVDNDPLKLDILLDIGKCNCIFKLHNILY
jgi:hypothetical protein